MAEPARFDYARLAHPPVTFGHEKLKTNERIPAARRYIVEHALNEHHAGTQGDVGIVVQGGLYNTLVRALQQLGLADAFGASELPLLVLNVTYPIVADEIVDFAAGKRAVLVVEEGQPEYIERDILAALHRAGSPAALHGKDLLQMAGEYTVEVMSAGLASFVERHLPGIDVSGGRAWLAANAARRSDVARRLGKALPARPPGFCIGCPERPVFAALKLAQQDVGPVHIAADIGCHALATFEPFSSGHSILGYGMSLASSAGVAPMMKRRVLSIMGDGGFWHNGLLTGVQSSLFNGDDSVLLIMKNGYTSATGTQDIISTPDDDDEGARARSPAEPGRPQHDDRVDARRPRRQVAAHRPHLPRRRDEEDAARGVHERLPRPEGDHRRGRMPARAAAPRAAVDRLAAEEGQARRSRQATASTRTSAPATTPASACRAARR